MISIQEDLGCVPGKDAAGVENSRLINEALVKRKGGLFIVPPGKWFLGKPLEIPAGVGAMFIGEVGLWRHRSPDFTVFLPSKKFPLNKKRYLLEWGGTDVPNGQFRHSGRDCGVERIAFNCSGREDVGGVRFSQCEQSRVISCQFYKCRRGIRFESVDLRINLSLLVQSTNMSWCGHGVSIVGEGGGQTFGGVNLQSLLIQKCRVGVYQESVNVPTHMQCLIVQSSQKAGLRFVGAKATLTSSYYEQPGAWDFMLEKTSTLYLVGWNRAATWEVDYSSTIVGSIPE